MGKRAVHRGILTGVGLLAVVLGAFLFGRAPAAAPPRAADAAGPGGGFPVWRGVSSCTSSACHNQDAGRADRRGGPAKGGEYATWFEKDPHARAYQVLFDRRSVDMQKKLNAFEAPEKKTLAHRNILCLRCHIAPEAEEAADAAPVWFSDGVGCESCHGAAGDWLAAHVGPGWKQMSQKEKEKHGFHDTKDLAVRAKTCTDCHVGGDRAEVNHDLYAAGHPPLQFEFSSALDRYRPFQHWSEADDRRRNPAHEADAWAVGQAASARAALRLLAARATAVAEARADKRPDSKPWPEFAEYACSSCHHGLEQQRPPVAGRRPGSLPWSWYVDLTALLPDAPAAVTGESPDGPLAALRTEMGGRNPDPARVAARAGALAGVYGEWLDHHPTAGRADSAALRRRLDLLTSPEARKIADGGWEAARQLSLAVSAHYRSLGAMELRPGGWRLGEAVSRLDEQLRLPRGQDTPRGFDPRETEKAMIDINDLINGR